MQGAENNQYEVKRLQRENIALMEELKLKGEECNVARELVSLFTGDYVKELDDFKRELKSFHDFLIGTLNENMELKEKLAMADKLMDFIMDSEEKLYVLTRGKGRDEISTLNICKSYRVSAKILCYAVEGCTTEEIVRNMADGGISVSLKRVNHVLSVKGDEDEFRVRAVLHQFSNIFREHGISEEDVLKWFSETRIKKLKLLDRSEVQKRFGEEVLNSLTPDIHVTGEYYDVRGMQVRS